MKKHTKPIIFLVVLILLAFAIVGCGSKTGINNDVDNKADAKSGEERDEEDENLNINKEDIRDKYEAFDLGGRTIKISSWWPVVPDSNMKKPDPTVYSEDIVKYENIKRIEEKYNCAIEFIEVPWEQLESKLEESVLEGSPFADIVYLPMNFSVSAIAKGYLLPVSEFVSPNSDVLTDNIVVTLMGKLIDDEYGIKTVEVPDNGVFMGYNKSIIDELDLETPMEIYKNNFKSWNWEKFLEYAKAATGDTDGDGEIDRFGYGGFIHRTIANFVVANDGEIFSDFESGKHRLKSPKTIRALEFINELYNVHNVAYIAEGDLWNYEANYSSFKNGNILFFPILSWMLEEIKGLSFEYGIVPFPTGPDNISGKTCAISYDAFYIPKGVKEPEKVYQVLEELLWFFGDNIDLRDAGKEKWLRGLWVTEESYEMSIEVSKYHGKLEMYEFVPDFPMGEIMGAVILEGMTVKEAVELYDKQAQDAIDRLLEKNN